MINIILKPDKEHEDEDVEQAKTTLFKFVCICGKSVWTLHGSKIRCICGNIMSETEEKEGGGECGTDKQGQTKL